MGKQSSDKLITPLLETRYQRISRWVTLQERHIRGPHGNVEIYHSLKQTDYFSLVALTPEREAVFVRQYRPAIDEYTVETPGGLVEEDENLSDGVCRELEEEAGYFSNKQPYFLGTVRPDVGRLGNWFHGFFVGDVTFDPAKKTEVDIHCFVASAELVGEMIVDGEISSAPHIWLLTQAALLGYWPEFLDVLNSNCRKRVK